MSASELQARAARSGHKGSGAHLRKVAFGRSTSSFDRALCDHRSHQRPLRTASGGRESGRASTCGDSAASADQGQREIERARHLRHKVASTLKRTRGEALELRSEFAFVQTSLVDQVAEGSRDTRRQGGEWGRQTLEEPGLLGGFPALRFRDDLSVGRLRHFADDLREFSFGKFCH